MKKPPAAQGDRGLGVAGLTYSITPSGRWKV